MNHLEAEKGRRVVEALPRSIRIGPHDFTIDKWHATTAAGARRYGECSTAELSIRIQLDMASPSRAVETFVHELLHAMYAAADLRDSDNEERVCGALSAMFVQVLRDNRWLAEWMTRSLA